MVGLAGRHVSDGVPAGTSGGVAGAAL